jgi:hypothetical protein
LIPLPDKKEVEAAAKQLEGAAIALRKIGKASVKITRVAYANDEDFEKRPPHCHVTLRAQDAKTDDDAGTWGCDLFGAEPPDNTHNFVIPVNKVFKFKRKLKLTVTAEPIQGYESYYDEWTSEKPPHPELHAVTAGAQIHLTCSLRPKKKGRSADLLP